MALRPSRREMSSGRMTGSLAVPCLFPPGRPGLAGAWPCPGSPRTERRDQGLGHGVESSGGGRLPHCPRWRHGRWPHWRSEEHVHAQRTTEANPADDGCRTDRGASPAIGAGGRGRSRRRAPAAGPDHWRAHPWHEHRDRAGCRDRNSTRLNSSHLVISYAVFCLKKKKKNTLNFFYKKKKKKNKKNLNKTK